MNTIKLSLYHLSRISKTFIAPQFLGQEKIFFKPTFISFEAEDRCNLKCLHCNIWKTQKLIQRMKLQETKKMIKKLENWLGFFRLNITGGEPFLSKNMIPLIEFSSKLGITIHVNSNGFLINKKMAKKITQSGLASLAISLDSLRPNIHNYLRGEKKAFQKTTNALGMISKMRHGGKPFLSIATIINNQNLEELEKIVHWARKKRLDGVIFQPLWQNFGVKYKRDWFKKSKLWPKDYFKVDRVINRLIDMKKKEYPILNSIEDLTRYKQFFNDPISFGLKNPCFTGINSFNIDLSGDVRLCFGLPPIGNILKEKPNNIWNGKKARRQRKRIANCNRGCKVLICNAQIGKKQALLDLRDKSKKILIKLKE